MNKLAAFAIAILLISGAALWLLAPGAFNDFIKNQIETIGSDTTQQTVKVNKVDFQLTKGMAAINGLSISNSKGYQQPNLFTLGEISLDIDIASLAKDPIIVESFTINDAKAFVEMNKSGHANFQEVIKAINSKLPKTDTATTTNDAQQEPNIRVDKLILSCIGLTLDLRQLGYKEYQEKLPLINLGAIGGEKGLPASKLGIEISKKILANIWQQAKKVQAKKLKAKAKEQLKKEVKKLKDKYKDKYKDKAKKKLGALLDKFKNQT